MSIVLWNQGTLYADSVGVVGGTSYKKHFPKLRRDSHNDLAFALCGELPSPRDLDVLLTAARLSFENWYFGADQQGTPVFEQTLLTGLIIYVAWNNGCMSFMDDNRTMIYDIYDTKESGNGGTFFLAALDAGCTPDEAGKIARRLSPGSGEGILMIDCVNELDAPLNINNIEVGSIDPVAGTALLNREEGGVTAIHQGVVTIWDGSLQGWIGTQRIPRNMNALYTPYGYFVPYGENERLFLSFCELGKYNHYHGIRGGRAGLLLSSDEMIYEIGFYCPSNEILGNGDATTPGRFELRPVCKYWDGFQYLLSYSWLVEYIRACHCIGLSTKEALELADKRLVIDPLDAYAHIPIREIFDELKKRGTPPAINTKLHDIDDAKFYKMHYRRIIKPLSEEIRTFYNLGKKRE